MEQPKFRGRQLGNGKWLYGSLLIRGERRFICPFEGEPRVWETEVDPKTVGQCVPKPAMNGSGVWVGDVVLAETLGGKDKLIIGWGDRGFIQIAEDGYEYADWFPVVEVIGNIHDSPDLTPPEAHYETLPKKAKDPWRCAACGSLGVEVKVWVDANTNEITDEDNIGANDRWCGFCGEHTDQIPESELMEIVEEWFEKYLLPDDDEVISGLERDDFASDEEFDAACKENWDARDVEGKIDIWYKLTHRQ